MNYYEILGLDISASIEEIKQAYRKLAMQYHPDRHRNNNTEERFKTINQAYHTLSDMGLRKNYDMNILKIVKMQPQGNVTTAPYDAKLNVFDERLKEVFELIKQGNPRVIRQLLTMQPTISMESHYYQKYTPLMEAAYLGDKAMVEYICNMIKEKYTRNNYVSYQYRGYLNQVNIEGKSALMIATLSNNKVDVLRYLVAEGASLQIRDKFDKDIFEYALFSNTQEIEDFVASLKK